MKSAGSLYDRPRVGGDVLCFCSRCKMNLAHVVVAMVDGKPKRVACKTCKVEHVFRSGGVARPSEGRPRARATRTVMLASELWQQRVGEMKTEPIPYDPKRHYKKGDCLSHAKFGLGCIEEVRLAGKVLVLFRDGEKLLIHSSS